MTSEELAERHEAYGGMGQAGPGYGLEQCAIRKVRAPDRVLVRDQVESAQVQPPWRVPMVLVSGMVVLALAAVFVLSVGLPERVTLKGDTAILVSVKRNQAFVLRDRDAKTVKDLQPGDQLSIHVAGRRAHLTAYVQVADKGVWRDYYRGEVPVGGWLPLGLEVTAGERTHMRIAVCGNARSVGGVVDPMSPAECTWVALEL